jgi:hypothetical protein
VSPTPSRVQSVADCVNTNVGSLETKSFLDNTSDGKVKECLRLLTRSHRRTFPHLDLLSRTDFGDLGEALGLFSRMIDELD